jgi:hypothetical protein
MKKFGERPQVDGEIVLGINILFVDVHRQNSLHRPHREYLLKGLIRCVYCGLPMWAQTYNSGLSYYREHRGSRGEGTCVNQGSSIPSHIADEQIGRIIEAIQLPDAWLDAVLDKINLQDETKRVA